MQLDSKNNVVSELEINIARLNEDLQNTFATIDKLEAEKSDAEETIHNLRNTMDTSNILKEKESNLENKLLLSNQEIDDLKNQKEKYEVSTYSRQLCTFIFLNLIHISRTPVGRNFKLGRHKIELLLCDFF